MAITYPLIFTPVHNEEVKFPDSVTEEVVRKLAQNSNLLARLAPIGTIRMFALNQHGVGTPDSTLWQLCDGSEITNPLSPLRTVGLLQQFTPNMLNQFLRGATDTSTNSPGGTPSINLMHNHGGVTGNFAPGFAGDGDIQVPSMHNHDHSIDNDLAGAGALDPAHQEVALYLKINF